MAHKFVVGQIVDLTRMLLRQAAAGEYEIRRLPPTLLARADEVIE